MIDEEGNIKLVDLGYAKIMKKDKTYTLCGTEAYMSPELI
jgi:serine/threonine protein kinase